MTEADRPLPRLAMLRDLTDRAVLDRVFAEGRTTRAELAARTGISKPTISESVRRLEAAGLLRATGSDQTGRRGRVATFYELATDAGYVLAVTVDQAGVHTLTTDLTDEPITEHRHAAGRPGDRAALTDALRDAVRAALVTGRGPLRAVALSVANPVDPATREVIALPESPFPEGGVRPREILADLVTAPVLVDNDVNFAALTERRIGAARGVDSFAYVYVGAGLGMSLYVGDRLIRGAHGLAGEIGYLTTDPPHRLAGIIARQGFGRPDAPSLDVAATLAVLDRAGDASARDAVTALGRAIGQAVAAVCTIVDPELVLLGGPVGRRAELLEPVRSAVAESAPATARIELGEITESAALRGARLSAVDTGRLGLVG